MKIKLYLSAAFVVMLILSSINTKAAVVIPVSTTTYSVEQINSMTIEQKQARILEIKDRISEIRAMDKSTLTRDEKKELRSELRDMRKEARAINSSDGMGGGVYLSVGAIIIIILLLILILH